MTKKDEESSIWDCKKCCLQMVGGPRCFLHNPTPEMHEASGIPYRSSQRWAAPPSKPVRKRKATR